MLSICLFRLEHYTEDLVEYASNIRMFINVWNTHYNIIFVIAY